MAAYVTYRASPVCSWAGPLVAWTPLLVLERSGFPSLIFTTEIHGWKLNPGLPLKCLGKSSQVPSNSTKQGVDK